MQELLIIMASAMPFDRILEELEIKIVEYKEAQLLGNKDSIEEAKRGMLLYNSLLMIKATTSNKSPMEVISEMDKLEKGRQMMDKLEGKTPESGN